MFGFLKKKSKTVTFPAADTAEQQKVQAEDAPELRQDVSVTEEPPREEAAKRKETADGLASGAVASGNADTARNISQDVSATTEDLPPVTISMAELEEMFRLEELPDDWSSQQDGWGQRLWRGLTKTRGGLSGLFGGRQIDEELLEDLEATLLMADCGIEATEYLLSEARARWKSQKLETADQLQQVLKELLYELLAPLEVPLAADTAGPFIIMLAGINGAGKTTSIGKLAHYFQAQGKSVLLAAGDTFRAAAREQLIAWGERNHVTVIAQEKADSAAVIFDAIQAAKARNIDVVLADTAGRLPTQLHLMDEIAKVRRVIGKAQEGAPHEVMLVLDANIGQNALMQVRAFDGAIGVTGLVITKLDGTAKGGVIAAIAKQVPKPLRFIGVGEGINDLQPFRAREFVDALFSTQAEDITDQME